GKGLARRDRRLRGVRNAVVLPGVELVHAVPVDRMRQRRVVLDLDLDIVAFLDVYERTRCLPVERERVEGLLVDQGQDRVFDRELEVMRFGGGRRGQDAHAGAGCAREFREPRTEFLGARKLEHRYGTDVYWH